MTVYELIQELAKYDANMEIRIDFTNRAAYKECPSCHEDVDIDSEEKTANVIANVQMYGSRLHIECRE